jgi:2-keto-4-pentenoate hydratase/2-oxohepta-3-ene-1,7-dioic acid hydratase in catechol pathway
MNVSKENIKNLYFVGRNYLEHAKELNNEKPDKVLLFTKPISSLGKDNKLCLPSHSVDVHFEGEMVFFISEQLKKIEDDTEIIAGCGLDFTARDVQAEAKSKGLPWFEAKCFKGSAVISDSFEVIKGKDLPNLEIKTIVNKKERQRGSYTDKMFKLEEITTRLNMLFDFTKGDLVFTGTPKGVGKVEKGDVLEVLLLLKGKVLTSLRCEVV